ncbi:GxxExxY protein [Haloferula sargassicola]|uniref:GxxExxY protein n=1 Tax=Haloferula sargassicola TaxID=490096 RepID=A0ABP9UJN8_9BACT
MDLETETKTIIGMAYEVMNEIGCGLREKAYERALVRDFQLQSIAHDQQRQFPVIYKDTVIDTLIPDLIVFDRIIIDTKTIEHITSREIAQMLNYLRITRLPVGLIINFYHPRVQIKRVHLSPKA